MKLYFAKNPDGLECLSEDLFLSPDRKLVYSVDTFHYGAVEKENFSVVTVREKNTQNNTAVLEHINGTGARIRAYDYLRSYVKEHTPYTGTGFFKRKAKKQSKGFIPLLEWL